MLYLLSLQAHVLSTQCILDAWRLMVYMQLQLQQQAESRISHCSWYSSIELGSWAVT